MECMSFSGSFFLHVIKAFSDELLVRVCSAPIRGRCRRAAKRRIDQRKEQVAEFASSFSRLRSGLPNAFRFDLRDFLLHTLFNVLLRRMALECQSKPVAAAFCPREKLTMAGSERGRRLKRAVSRVFLAEFQGFPVLL